MNGKNGFKDKAITVIFAAGIAWGTVTMRVNAVEKKADKVEVVQQDMAAAQLDIALIQKDINWIREDIEEQKVLSHEILKEIKKINGD